MITYVKGDVRDTDAPFIVHGCNAQGAMGSGVARALFERWPDVKTEYTGWMERVKAGGFSTLPMGACQFVMVDRAPRKYVINMITQDYYGKDGSKYVSYDAVDRGMIQLKDSCEYMFDGGVVDCDRLVISMPKIGSGLGGGSWKVIESIITHRLSDIDVRVYEL